MDVIILSAGIGQRTKLNIPKQLMRLGGKPLLIHVVEVFNSIDYIDNIIITVPCDIDYYESLIQSYNINNFKCIIGGKTRQESMYIALQHVNSDYVIIHESARPFITKEFVSKLYQTEGSAVVPVVNITSTVVQDIEDEIGHFPSRDTVKLVQLPQKFKTSLLRTAHEYFKDRDFTDDSSLVAAYDELEFYKARLTNTRLIEYIEGLEQNIKITTSLDTRIAEEIYENFGNSDRRV